jgi:type I restriction enzyme S subunit
MNIDREGRLDLSVVKYVPEQNNLRVRPGDVLFNNTNSPELVGKTTFIPGGNEYAFSNHMTRLRPPANVSARFVAYQLHFLWVTGYFRHRCTHHVNQASIGSATLADSVPLLIAPSLEQCRIVAEIEKQFTRLDAALAALKRVQANLKRYRASVLKAACEGRLVPTEAELARADGRDYEPADRLLNRILAARRAWWEQEQLQKMQDRGEPPKNDRWKQKYKEPSPPDLVDLPDLPAGWCWASVEQLASPEPRSIQSGPFGSSLLHSEFQESGVLAIGIDNVLDGKFSLGSQNRIGQAKYDELMKYSARPLDVLITVMATVGRCCVLPQDTERAIITKHVYRISVDLALVNPFFLMNALRGSGAVQAQLKRGIRGQTRPGINGTILRALAIPLPPIHEQSRIIAEIDRRLSLVYAMDDAVQGGLKRSDRLRQSVLKLAFEGRLVPQDPNDEPASVLLDRIRAERAPAAAPETREVRSRRRRQTTMVQDRPAAKKTIIEALNEAKAPLSPEKLFSATGHQPETIDEFYGELKAGVDAGQIEELRTGDEGVLLRAKLA